MFRLPMDRKLLERMQRETQIERYVSGKENPQKIIDDYENMSFLEKLFAFKEINMKYYTAKEFVEK